jgi:hypothetical protein
MSPRASQPTCKGEDPLAALENRYDIAGYLDYQGEKLVERFDAKCYLVISKPMEPSNWLAVTAQKRRCGEFAPRCWRSPWSTCWRSWRAAGVDSRHLELVSNHAHDGFPADTHLLAPLLSERPGAREANAHRSS